MDLNNLEWNFYPQNINGRTAFSYIQINSKIYIFGSSKSGELLILDLENNLFNIENTSGCIPNFEISGAEMINIGKYLFFIGGKDKCKYMSIYTLDIEKKWWFVFHIKPDCDTTTFDDGIINDIGLFLIPRIDSFGCVYLKNKRKIITLLCNPQNDPPYFNSYFLGDALGIINLRDDLLDMLKF